MRKRSTFAFVGHSAAIFQVFDHVSETGLSRVAPECLWSHHGPPGRRRWNIRYMGYVLDEFRNAGMPINPEGVERLSPLLHHHIHLDGRYTFALPEVELRPPRDPADPAEQVFDLLSASA
jgi:hypothetical protein